MMAQTSVSKLSASTQRSNDRGGGPLGGTRPAARYECTYKMEPDLQFMSHKACGIIEDVLESQLQDTKYDPERCPHLCRHLADTIKNKVKDLQFSRYKIVAVVTIGSLSNGASSCASQCVWNDKFDTYSEFTYKNGSLYALGTVYGIYQE
ncbi:tctex1 domain-containing protein 1-B-like [Asterias rubens]|uniref:tctex1 domain-containing protein 1-B-like n=2 Tax=Asterias TaxID=7601 RepID=UPI0014550339|nr:tctex1 domain-containing protein 1-B-like [Asterias rubens]